MITGELSWAWVALSFAWTGAGVWPFADSYLHTALAKRHFDLAWCLFIGVPAVMLMFYSLREWTSHCTGRAIDLEASARMRGRLCLVMAFSWMYAVYVMSAVSVHASPVTPVAIGGAFYMLMFWIENRRVQRDVKKYAGIVAAA